MLNEVIAVGVITVIGNIIVSLIANHKTTALVTYRLEKLEEKVNKHNQVVERTYKLEEKTALHQQRLDAIEKDIEKEKK